MDKSGNITETIPGANNVPIVGSNQELYRIFEAKWVPWLTKLKDGGVSFMDQGGDYIPLTLDHQNEKVCLVASDGHAIDFTGNLVQNYQATATGALASGNVGARSGTT